MGVRDDRIIVFRDDRYMLKDKKIYLILKEDNRNLTIDGTNKIYLFIKMYESDEIALSNIEKYNDPIDCLIQINGIENIAQILFDKEIKTISKLADIITNANYEVFEDFKYTPYYIFMKNRSCIVKQADNGYEITKNDLTLVANPIFVLNESYFRGKQIDNKLLFVTDLPDGLNLITDTNPDRNIVPETV